LSLLRYCNLETETSEVKLRAVL